jgi:ribosomal protein L16 Arg81 hydroxylase
MDSRQRPLDQLLAPFSTSAFLRDHWDRQSLYIRGSDDKLAALRFDRAALFSAIAEADSPPETKAQYIDEHGVHAEFSITGHDPSFLNHQFQAGLTICARDLGRQLPAVDAFARALERQLDLGSSIMTSCYVSNIGKGFGLHFDSNPVIVLQCEGSKRWLYGQTPAVTGPGHNVVASHERDVVEFVRERPWSRLRIPREQDLDEATLRPGDVLYLPAGTWHRAYAEAPSTAWTFTLVQPSWFTLLDSLLWRRVRGDPVWRTSPPVGPDSGNGERWHERPEAREFIAARLAELRELIGLITVDDFAEIAGARTAPPADARPARAPAPLQREDALMAGRREDLALVIRPGEDGRDVLAVFWGDDGVEVPAACEPIIERAFAAGRFVAGDVVGWFDAENRPTCADAQALLESLLALGMLSPAGDRFPTVSA